MWRLPLAVTGFCVKPPFLSKRILWLAIAKCRFRTTRWKAVPFVTYWTALSHFVDKQPQDLLIIKWERFKASLTFSTETTLTDRTKRWAYGEIIWFTQKNISIDLIHFYFHSGPDNWIEFIFQADTKCIVQAYTVCTTQVGKFGSRSLVLKNIQSKTWYSIFSQSF